MNCTISYKDDLFLISFSSFGYKDIFVAESLYFLDYEITKDDIALILNLLKTLAYERRLN